MKKINLETTNSTSIMNCSTLEAIELCSRQLLIVDDMQQFCVENDPHVDFSNEYDFFEQIARNTNPSDFISLEKRNEIRLTCKHLYKIGVVMGFDFNNKRYRSTTEE